MSLRRWVVLLSIVSAVLGVSAAPAWATFPGGDGLLAVHPLTGPGVVLARTGGTVVARDCQEECGLVGNPRFAPDGRSLAVASTYGLKLLGIDGACLDCQFNHVRAPAFRPDGTELTVTAAGALAVDGIDSLRRGQVLAGPLITDADWSATGKLAVVQAGLLRVGFPDALRTVGPGTNPSWAPVGPAVVYAHRGWVMLYDGRRARRLVPGSAPAFSPDGRMIAYADRRHDIRIWNLATGRSRAAGHLRGLGLDWQPVVTTPARCALPAGTQILASDAAGLVTADQQPGLDGPDDSYSTGHAYMGCLYADGRPRLLLQATNGTADGESSVLTAAMAGTRAVLAVLYVDPHYMQSDDQVQSYDLSTGTTVPGPKLFCPNNAPDCGFIDHIVLAPDGAYAVHSQGPGPCTPQDVNGGCTIDSIVAVDGAGARTEDEVIRSGYQSSPALTGLSITGQTISWYHPGESTPRTAQLG